MMVYGLFKMLKNDSGVCRGVGKEIQVPLDSGLDEGERKEGQCWHLSADYDQACWAR